MWYLGIVKRPEKEKGRMINLKGGHIMAMINPLTKRNAEASVHALYDGMIQKFGFMPNIFGVMAHRPEALASFIPFFQLMMSGETLTNRDRELVYLATSMFNGCEY